MTTHSFSDSLAWSRSFDDAPWWREVYTTAFPALQSMESVRSDGWAQRGGIDRLLILDDGTTLKVDEKVRSKDWPDFCLEYWSDYARRTPGWATKSLTCDYIAYAFVPSQTCYLLPFQLLKRACLAYEQEWSQKHRHISARNNGYTTWSLAVPIDVVLDAIRDGLVITWGRRAA